MVSFYCFGRGTFRAFSGGLTKKVWWSSIWRPGHLCTLCDICNQHELPSGWAFGKKSVINHIT